jgi:N-acetylmuramoyl-L-alanine amidase
MVKHIAAALFVLAASSAAGASEETVPGVATIKGIRRTVLTDTVRVTIELDREVPFRDERIPGPVRVFVDLPGTRPAAALLDQTIRFDSDADIVRQVRIGRHPNNTTRIVLDAVDVSTYSVYPLYNPFRIVIDCMRATTARAAAASASSSFAPTPPPRVVSPPSAAMPALPAVRPLQARPIAWAWMRRPPSSYPQASFALGTAYAAMPSAGPAAPEVETLAPESAPPVRATAAAPPSAAVPNRNGAGGYSISRQLGLGVSRIVIDPGHGGHDPGARGKGVNEAELVLDVAVRLEKLLQKERVEVILTRRTDDFITLQERTAIANREGADLFLSIHANASPNPQARGVETYFLNFTNNMAASAVAARENAASGQAMGALPDLVKTIALNNKLDESRDFAAQIQHAMLDRLRPSNASLKDLGVKQAPFVVLIGAAMPSVLAEISFVTNPQEAKLLKTPAYRQRIAEALFSAIRRYQTSLKNPTAVASQ